MAHYFFDSQCRHKSSTFAVTVTGRTTMTSSILCATLCQSRQYRRTSSQSKYQQLRDQIVKMLNPALSAVALLLLLTAAKAQPVTVRLVGGANPQEGRLEVNYNGTWGTVCNHGFTDVAAGVVCYSLGFGHSGGKRVGNRFGRGTGPVWLDNVWCDGRENEHSRLSAQRLGQPQL